MKLVLTCPRGCGQFLKNEVIRLGCDVDEAQTGFVRVSVQSPKAIAHLNVWSRIANTVFVELGKVQCASLDDYFAMMSAVQWSDYVVDGQGVIVTAQVGGKGFDSPKTLQSLGMKSIMKTLTSSSTLPDAVWEIDETLDPLRIHVVAIDGQISVLLNTSGAPLWKRGYRLDVGDAPLKENVAVCLLLSLGWRWKEALYDPCCGSGTICIEAAMMAINRAPGLERRFAFEHFEWYDDAHTRDVRQEAKDAMFGFEQGKYTIQGSDVDAEMVMIARDNAQAAGVSQICVFGQKDIADYESVTGVICSNPPYGMRLMKDDTDRASMNVENGGVYTVHKCLVELLMGDDTRGGFLSGWGLMQDKWKVIRDTLKLPYSKVSWKPKVMMNGGVECSFWKVV